MHPNLVLYNRSNTFFSPSYKTFESPDGQEKMCVEFMVSFYPRNNIPKFEGEFGTPCI